MSTIMQRWVAVKTELAAEGQRILACAQEARSLVEAQCGQDPGTMHRDETRGWVVCSWEMKPLVQILAGSWYVTLTKADPKSHLSVPLSAAEKALAQAKMISTGTFVELWEREESAKV